MEVRINKYLADAGVASRRQADKLVESGQVTINGIVARNADRVAEGDKVCIKGKQVFKQEEKHVVVFYKPEGVTCTNKDKYAKVTIDDAFRYPIKLNYAGRLDKDSKGLLIMTNDGELIDRMMRARNHHEKEYIVKVNCKITDTFMKQMSEGIYLDELDVKTRPCKVIKVGDYTFRIVLTQGLNRQIRRMCAELGYKVESLMRVRIMNIEVGDLKPGEFRRIEGEELQLLYQQAGLERN
ncbi:MAG: rRNA pseudouridine synthase [Lachnospiraceae bacterium]|nr:rRNA pseudouridine synthase [Lachnospiraceae bacterium]